MPNRETERVREWLIRDKYRGNVLAGELEKDMARIARGEPADYVIGWRDFLGARIDLSFRPLIPREATEYWVEKAIAEIGKGGHERTLRILDLFSGSGAIGVALLRHLPGAHVDFGELDRNFVKQIEFNLELNSIPEERFQVFETDVFGNIAGGYDYIFANPPYLARERRDEIQKSVIDFEPHHALFGEDGGMSFLVSLFSDAKRFLSRSGAVYFEFHSPQKDRIEVLLARLGYRYDLRKDQFDLYRWGRAWLS